MALRQNPVIRGIRNARKWTKMLVTGQAPNLSDLAKKLGLAAPYVTRILGLANLSPDIVKAICNGCEPEGVSLARLVKGFSDDWGEAENGTGIPEPEPIKEGNTTTYSTHGQSHWASSEIPSQRGLFYSRHRSFLKICEIFSGGISNVT